MARGRRAAWLAWGAALVLAGVAAACDPAGSGVEPEPVAAAARSEGAGEVSAAPAEGASRGSGAAGSASPIAELIPPVPGQERLMGVVAEQLPAGGYTYLRIEPERGEPQWVVTMRRDVGAGDRVRVESLGSRHDFYSRRLDRRFAELVFGVVEIVG